MDFWTFGTDNDAGVTGRMGVAAVSAVIDTAIGESMG